MTGGLELPEQSKRTDSPDSTLSATEVQGATTASMTQSSIATAHRARNRRASAHHADETFSSLSESHHEYNWRMFAPKQGVGKFLKWLITGHAISPPALSEQEAKEKIDNLARALSLLRDYEAKFGMPNGGSKKEQEWVLEELCKGLYSSGTPVWVLEPVMHLGAEGLTGLPGFGFFLLPASGIISPPQDTQGYSSRFFQMRGGFCLYRINMYEKVLARLASFCTNTRTMNSLPDEHLPKLLTQDVRRYSDENQEESLRDQEFVAKEILDMASQGYGLFFLTRAEEILTQQQEEKLADAVDEFCDAPTSDGEASILSYHSFWTVDESIRDLFSRLATIEAAECLDAIKRSPGLDSVWPRRYIVLFRILSSAGASALWFNGSWQDVLLSGGIAGVVALVFQTNTHLWKNQRMIFEIVVSYIVGLTAGLVSIRLPENTCFSAIAIASMIDYLRGFGIVFAIMEVMSRNKMSGSSDLIEALIFSFLISMSIFFGLFTAESIMGIDQAEEAAYMECGQPLSQLWFILILPLASLAWAAGFRPARVDLPLMATFGVLSFVISWAVENVSNNGFLGSFVAALTTSTVAGVVSRFTGRQALGDTFTGLFALVPGIYVIEGLFAAATGGGYEDGSFFITLILKAVIIGVGSWCGTLLCAPTHLGTNTGILSSQTKQDSEVSLGAMLYI